jgi:hypothetical protein
MPNTLLWLAVFALPFLIFIAALVWLHWIEVRGTVQGNY